MGISLALQMVMLPVSFFCNMCTKRLVLHFFMLQAFDAPWPIIQANAIYFSSCMLSLSDDQHILTLYYAQVSFRQALSFYDIAKTNIGY